MKSIFTALALAGLVSSVAPSVNAKAADGAKTEARQVAPKVFDSPQKLGTKATCPVTGEEFVIGKNTIHAEYKGKYVYFCCPGCKKAFDKNPEKYTK